MVAPERMLREEPARESDVALIRLAHNLLLSSVARTLNVEADRNGYACRWHRLAGFDGIGQCCSEAIRFRTSR
jgi:hypothetical protein